VEDGSSSGINLTTTVITGIACAVLNPMVLGYLLALHTMDAFRPAKVLKPFKTSLISRELCIKIFGSIFLHFLTSLTLPFYHRLYLLSRDNYLKII